MTIQEKIDALKKEFETKIAELEKQLVEEQKQSKVWEPKEEEPCWVIFSNGIDNICWHDEELNNKAYLRGSVVKTEKEAEWADQHRIIATELKHFVAENDPHPITEEDWVNDVSRETIKYFIRYDYWEDCIWVEDCYSSKTANQVYASNEEVLKKAIEHISEERLKKYYFGVEK